MKALIFDCDGVLVDTERDGHRVAFNRAFAERGYDFQWDVRLYGELLKIAGGKERMKHYFDKAGWPSDAGDKEEFIRQLHKSKTNIFMNIIESGQLPLRNGVERIVDEALADGMFVAVCSTSNERAVGLIVEKLLGGERKNKFAGIFAGDVVAHKKPDPEIYDLAKKELGVEPEQCIVIEDSRNGLLAAKAAGMYCVITTNGYTQNEDFTDADLVVAELGDGPDVKITLAKLKEMIKKR